MLNHSDQRLRLRRSALPVMDTLMRCVAEFTERLICPSQAYSAHVHNSTPQHMPKCYIQPRHYRCSLMFTHVHLCSLMVTHTEEASISGAA